MMRSMLTQHTYVYIKYGIRDKRCHIALTSSYLGSKFIHITDDIRIFILQKCILKSKCLIKQLSLTYFD